VLRFNTQLTSGLNQLILSHEQTKKKLRKQNKKHELIKSGNGPKNP